MPSIVNGLFAGRAGIASHGAAIAVVGDNISNANTPGFKAGKALFEDLVAGGQTAGKVIGSGSGTSAVAVDFSQGTVEFTGRELDLSIDGNGFFVVQELQQRFYSRAGNFKVNSAGFLVNQRDQAVLGFPANGSGSLEPINVNNISQDSTATNSVTISGNVDARATTIDVDAAVPDAVDAGAAPPVTETVTFSNLNTPSEFSTFVEVFDTLGQKHTITFFFYKGDNTSSANEYTVKAYVNSEDVDATGTATGFPRELVPTGGVSLENNAVSLQFGNTGTRNNAPAVGSFDATYTVPWNNGSNGAATISVNFNPFTQFAASSNILSINQDGRGVGAVTSLSVENNGDLFALLDNGQSTIIGSVGLVNFTAPEGLSRIGKNLLQQSSNSGEPIVGRPNTGTFGSIQAGTIELSTVDIANEFVRIITLQRGFQANSRIITTVNQLLNEIVQLA